MKLEIVIPLILLVFLNIDISYSSYPNHLASKLTNHYKDQLQNKNFSELVEICYYVDKYAKFTSHSKYDILAIIYHESRFNPLALNKIDHNTLEIAKKIDNKKEKYYLEYENFCDLLETVSIVKKYAYFDTIFTAEDVLTIIHKESKYNRFALNKRKSAIGLCQLDRIHKWYKDELFWVNDLYDKEQNIKAAFIILNDKYKKYKNKRAAIIAYNGRGKQALRYYRDFCKIKYDLFKL